MADTLSALTMQSQNDPDAQATVNDFLDYTEFFPSDLHRSLTLIGKLDQSYGDYSQQVHELTRAYGRLHEQPPAERPEPQKLRKEISNALNNALRVRGAAYAEASRLSNSADILYNRLVSIREKLMNLPKPPSRDPSPARLSRSPELQRKDRVPRITLFTDSNRPRSSGTQNHVPRPRRVIVPGEVLPPEEVITPGADFSSDDESEFESHRSMSRYRDKTSRERTPAIGRPPKMLKLDKGRKPPRPPLIRPPGQFGTNVHSQVAGISVSNAMALLERPPDNPVIGGKHAPWNELTEWELNLIRKRMKKNANWMPSEVMKKRELAARGRGRENFIEARSLAEANRTPFVCEIEPHFDPPVEPLPTVILAPIDTEDELLGLQPRPNETKKQLRDRERTERDRRELDELGKQITNAGRDLENSWSKIATSLNDLTSPLSTPLPTPIAESKKELTKVTSLRPKRGQSSAKTHIDLEEEVPGPRLLRLSTTALHTATADHESALASSAIDSVSTSPIATDTDNILAKDEPSSFGEKDETSDLQVSRFPSEPDMQHSGRSTRASATRATSTSATAATSASAREGSIGTSRISLKLTNKSAGQTEPAPRRLSLRRPTLSASEGPTTPVLAHSEAPKGPQTISLTTRRSMRPSQSLTVSNSEPQHPKMQPRAGPPLRIGPSKRNSTDAPPEESEDKPYCLPTCKFGGTSEGRMVACENDDCPSEWYHFECVGLQEMPKRTQKWFCPRCQKRLGVTERGEALPKIKKRKR